MPKRSLDLLLCLGLALALFLPGCAAKSGKSHEELLLERKLLEQRRQVLEAAERKRVESRMQTAFGLPKWVQDMLAPPKPSEPAMPAVAPPTRPSVIPGVSSVLVVGDSFSVGVGMTLSSALKGMGVRLLEKGKTSSGLNSPRFYNWEQKLSEYLTAYSPDVVVAMISGNDAHNGSGSDAWRQQYTGRLQSFLQIPGAQGVPVYLVGLPSMGKGDYSTRAGVANSAMQEVCEATSGCHYVDAWSLFSDSEGNYTRSKNFGGKVLTLRAKDGVHFTMTGYHLLSDRILENIARTLGN